MHINCLVRHVTSLVLTQCQVCHQGGGNAQTFQTVKQFLKSKGSLVIRHPNITQKDLFRYDVTTLNKLGNSVFLNSLQWGLETF